MLKGARPLPTPQLLDIATQAASALQAAHACGVVHGDLKPGNLLVTATGQVKLMDFGIARRAGELATHLGGTPGYMAPEQAAGKAVDAQSDIYSFGAVLHEMATGRAAVAGREGVPFPKDVPPGLVQVIQRCLANAPADRFQSMGDVWGELRTLVGFPSPAVRLRRVKRWALAAISVLSLLAAFTVGVRDMSSPGFPDQGRYRFTPFEIDPGGLGGVWSPDNRAVAFVTLVDGKYRTYVRYLDSALPSLLTDIPEQSVPAAWTPDGQRVWFYSDRKPNGIWSVAVAGGEPQPVFPLDPERDSIAGANRSLSALAVLHEGEDERWGLWVSDPVGSPLKKYVPSPFATTEIHHSPAVRFSPDGRRILLFIAGTGSHESRWLFPYPPDPSHPPAPRARESPCIRRDSALTSGTAGRGHPLPSPDGKKILFMEGTWDFDVVSASLENAAVRPLVSTLRNAQSR